MGKKKMIKKKKKMGELKDILPSGAHGGVQSDSKLSTSTQRRIDVTNTETTKKP